MAGNRQYVIIGNGAAGTVAAETLRRSDPDCSILLFGDEPYPLYNRVGLPPMLRGTMAPERVFMRTRERHQEQRIDLRIATRVVRINPREGTVIDETGANYRYDALLLATGGRPHPLTVPGGDLRHVYNFQTFDDAAAIMEQMRAARTAVVTGGSYIAYELAEACSERGLQVTWLIRGPRFLRRVIDAAGGDLVDGIARRHGVNIVYGEEIAAVLGCEDAAGRDGAAAQDGAVAQVVTTGGQRFPADLVGVGLGLKLNTELAEAAGIKVGKGILTDQYLETSEPGIFAAGDVAEFWDETIGQHNVMGTWNNATSHGKVAAANMAGGRVAYREVPTYTTTMFHTRMTAMGITPESKADLESVSRAVPEADSFRQLFFWRNRLVGCVVIGDMKAKSEYLRLIQSGAEMADQASRERLLTL